MKKSVPALARVVLALSFLLLVASSESVFGQG